MECLFVLEGTFEFTTMTCSSSGAGKRSNRPNQLSVSAPAARRASIFSRVEASTEPWGALTAAQEKQ
jgi:hypothetical protein